MRSLLIKIFIPLFGAFPLWLSHGLGSLFGRVIYRLNARERRTAEVNIRLCLPELSQPEQTLLVRETLKESGKTLLEMPAIWLKSPEYWLPRIVNAEQVAQELKPLLQTGKGLLIAAPHQGSWEVGAHFLGTLGPVTYLYRPPRESALEPFMLEGRTRSGNNKLAATDRAGIKAIYHALAAGEVVVVLPDQQPKYSKGSNGVFADLFGAPAYSMTLLSRLARKSGAKTIFLYLPKLPKGRYQVNWFEAPEAIADADMVKATTAMNQGVERCARDRLEQYQWTYRRFVARPDGGPNRYKRKR